jgi:hypothetical protein
MEIVSTKVDLNHNKVLRVETLDELAVILFPGNKNHQRIFLAIFVELKWADGQFLTALEPIADQHGFSRRSLETVRAKMRRLGLIDHVSRFNRKHGYREGWALSGKFERTLIHVTYVLRKSIDNSKTSLEARERDLGRYI